MTQVFAHAPPSTASRPTANAPPIYLDNQASTRVDPRVLETMLPYFMEQFGNPHSTSHPYGRIAAEAIEQARGEIAAVIRADPREIIFTSGATESNNLAIKGAAHFARAHPHRGQRRDHIITLQTEHKCVLESCKSLADEGFEVTYL
jgi:cysteine desulfurase